MSKELCKLIYKAMRMTGPPGIPKSIPLLPLNLVPSGFHFYNLPRRLQYLYMLADKIITEAGGNDNNLSPYEENLVGQVFGYMESLLRDFGEEFQGCYAILVCENWFALPLNKEKDEYLKFLLSDPFLTSQLLLLPKDKTLLN